MKNHLRENGLSYWKHLSIAYKYAFKLQKAVFAALIHGLFPDLFKSTASDLVKKLTTKR